VAVVSISRIQVRRGQKNQGTGLPQLASGEFGWAVDTQELYIGNGAVSEGAPNVGNTLMLTEHTDLFQYANYTYDFDASIIQTGNTPASPIVRSLQDRLDDSVSVKSFGVFSDGSDVTVELQKAIDQLFINTATVGNAASRVVLHMEAGTYTISDTIYLPPFATIKGAGIDKTVLNQTGTNPAFVTVNGNSIPGTPAADATSTFINQARSIEISGMTINANTTNRALDIISCRDSSFKDIKLISSWESGDAITNDFSAMTIDAFSIAVNCSNNIFENLQIEGFSNGILGFAHNNYNKFLNCRFEKLGYGIKLDVDAGEDSTVPSAHNTFENSLFKDIDRTALLINQGQYHVSSKNRYIGVGNDGGTASNATYPVIVFNDLYNDSQNDYFERAEELAANSLYINTTPFVPTVDGFSFHDEGYYIQTGVGYEATPVPAFRMPADRTRSFKIEYWYNSSAYNAHRSGTLNVVLDMNTETFQMSDEYDYVGDASYETKLKFTMSLSDQDATGGNDTLLLLVENTVIGDEGSLHFKIQNRS
jgi:hypothetical protein